MLLMLYLRFMKIGVNLAPLSKGIQYKSAHEIYYE